MAGIGSEPSSKYSATEVFGDPEKAYNSALKKAHEHLHQRVTPDARGVAVALGATPQTIVNIVQNVRSALEAN